jgi:tetraacyldisaccharide 4'-kinase
MNRPLLWPLVPLYAVAVRAKNAEYDHGWRKGQRLRWPVVSVGNLSVGGSGKTPLVIRLAELFQQRGFYVDVLSRGYGRNTDTVEQVDPLGSAERFGDEPLLIAQSAGIPVYVGASRYAAGLLAEKEHNGAGIHLLDDGMQHRQLARSVDIAVVHRSDLAGTLLPAGNLREPLSGLRRASIVVLRSEDADLEEQLRPREIAASVWWVERMVQVPQEARRPLVFCGIARPEEFLASLEAQGVCAAAVQSFRDHHRYTEAEMRQLVEMARSRAADCFLTTEKDFVRLSVEQRKMLSETMPLLAVKLVVRLRDEAAMMQQLLSLLSAAPSHPL